VLWAPTLGVVVTVGAPARAAPPQDPQGTGGQAAASSGATELEGQGKFTTATDPNAAPPEQTMDALEFSLSAGAILSTGNAEAAALTGASAFRIRRDIHQFSALGAGNWGGTRTDQTDWYDTVGNVQGRVRYDVFFAERWSAFLMSTARHDPFQGLDVRLNIDPGVAFYALPGPENRLWFEAGYDFQLDLRRDDAIVAKDANGQPILDAEGSTIRIEDEVALNHAARVFAGYSNRMTKAVTFDVGFEWLQSVIVARRFRFVGDLALTAALAERFAIATTFTIRYENQPLPDIKKLDTITSISLVYRLL
jgi:putative salt-induced outer membrane protein